MSAVIKIKNNLEFAEKAKCAGDLLESAGGAPYAIEEMVKRVNSVSCA